MQSGHLDMKLLTQLTKEKDNAIKERKLKENNLREYQERDESGQAPETSDSDSPIGSRKIQAGEEGSEKKMTDSLPFQYIRNKTTGKYKACGYADFSSQVKEGYELIIGELPEGIEQEKEITPLELVERLRELYMSLPVQHRAALADITSKVSQATGYGDYELAEFWIDNAVVPEGFESVRTAMRNILASRNS